MKTYSVDLNESEYSGLNASFPPGTGTALVGQRAEELVKIHLVRRFPACTFEPAGAAAALRVDFGDGSAPMTIDIEGTATADAALEPAREGAKPASFRAAASANPVFRVCLVFDRTPKIHMYSPGRETVGRAGARPSAKASERTDAEARKTTVARQQLPRVKATAPEKPAAPLEAGDELVIPEAPPPTTGEFGNRPRKLYEHLVKRGTELVSIPFLEFPAIVGAALPPTAFRDQSFWEHPEGITTSPWAQAWRKAGYEVDTFRLARDGGWVRFKRRP